MARTTYSFLSHYPAIAGIVYALKSDARSDKRIALALGAKDSQLALQIALASTARRHRYIALGLLWLKTQFHWLPPLFVTLWICRLVGPARAWFQYLQQSSTRPSLLTATTILQQHKKQGLILDIGCGIGQLSQQFPPTSGQEWICVDKNFFSLFLAQLYHSRKDITYVCADIEVQHLFPANTFTASICIDCFDFIYQKDVFVEQMAKILKTHGTFTMINIHEEQPGTELWGYGVDHHQLLRMLKKVFSTVEWHNMNTPFASARISFSQLDTMRYSFVAEK